MPALSAKKRISTAQLKAALKSSAGIAAVAAEKLGVTRQNVSQRIAGSPDLQAFIAEIDQGILDQAQAVVTMAMQERQPGNAKPTKEAISTSKWWLERRGRDRGFSTRTELANPDGSPLAPAAPVVHFHLTYVDAKPVDEDVV